MRRLFARSLLLFFCLLYLHCFSRAYATHPELTGHSEWSLHTPEGPNVSESAVDAAALPEEPQVTDKGGKWGREMQNAADDSSSSKEVTLRQHGPNGSRPALDASSPLPSPPTSGDDSLSGSSEAASPDADAASEASEGAVSTSHPESPEAPEAPPLDEAITAANSPVSSGRPAEGADEGLQQQQLRPVGQWKSALQSNGFQGGGGTLKGGPQGAAETAADKENKENRNTTQAAPLTCADLPCGEGQLTCSGPFRGRFLCICRPGFVLQRTGGQGRCVDSRSSSSTSTSSRSDDVLGTGKVQGGGGTSHESKWTILLAILGAGVGVLLLLLLLWGAISWHRIKKDPMPKSVNEEFSSLLDEQSSTRSSYSYNSRQRRRNELRWDSFESEAGAAEEKQVKV
ncbi:hypothetical protein, conserved [Eimeria acervulina]|uniref:EGF-like domain-containing protein n=1 Tax=Eimeria acervulina TaxID=5801 RepID=U6GKB6_EIMAC|nr:hypothetical protein, conserved [Eimeria acervulina]CDI80676.1 hypothetical protein, conserved [Eimeria acervulina]